MSQELLNKEEQEKIARAVARAEKSSSGEIATALIRESSDYAVYELIFSLIIGFLYFSVMLLFYSSLSEAVKGMFWNAPEWYVTAFYGLSTILVTGVAYFFSNLAVVDRLIVPRKVREREVWNRALRYFTESGVYMTRDHTGILIFISLMERRVEVLADKGISEKIPQAEWDGLVAELSLAIREGKLAEGLCQAVETCGKKLALHFPIKDDDTNELPNTTDILES